MSTLSSTSSPTGTAPGRVGAGRAVLLLLAGLIGAIVVNAIIAVVFRAAGASTSFRALTPTAYIPLTLFGFILSLAGWAVIRRASRRPAAVLRVLVPVMLVLSFIPDILVLANHSMPGVSGLAVAGLLLMHVTTAAIFVTAYRKALPVS